MSSRVRIGSVLHFSLVALALLVPGCGGGGGGASLPTPGLLSINNSSDPASPVEVAIQLTGTGFLAMPGEVRFTQGGNVAQLVPDASAWTGTDVIVEVPDQGSGGSFAVPGTVTVTVITAGGESNGIDLDLVETPVFNNGDVEWSTTTPLPTARAGHRAVAVPNTATSAWAIVVGGFDGVTNLTEVLSNALADDGQLGATWTATTALPAARAHHGMVVAHPQNAPLPADSRWIYVVGGQADAADAPGGTDTVWAAGVSVADGSVGPWVQLAVLPEPMLCPTVTLYNGFMYVIGGLRPDGTPIQASYTARILPDGSLAPWQLQAAPTPIASATAFAFGGNLYLMGGDTTASTTPNGQAQAGTKDTWSAPILNGQVGLWDGDKDLSKDRTKHVTWQAFGQVLAAGGVYGGSPGGGSELERSVIQPDATLSSWNSIVSSSTLIGANAYNAAAFVSPIRPAGAGPRFLLLGGQEYSSSPPGSLSSTVYYNTAP